MISCVYLYHYRSYNICFYVTKLYFLDDVYFHISAPLKVLRICVFMFYVITWVDAEYCVSRSTFSRSQARIVIYIFKSFVYSFISYYPLALCELHLCNLELELPRCFRFSHILYISWLSPQRSRVLAYAWNVFYLL